MRRLYYTLCVLLLCSIVWLAVRWWMPRPAPETLGSAPGTLWDLADARTASTSSLPLPRGAHPILRGVHLSGSADGILLVEAQTRLPGWLLRLVPVPGFKHRRSAWDLCLVREDLSEFLDLDREPSTSEQESLSAWIRTREVIRISLQGKNPYTFFSFLPGETREELIAGPSQGATILLAAGRSPHMESIIPGARIERVEAGPDWAVATLLDGGRKREVRWGAAAGPVGESKRLSLRLRYRGDAGAIPSALERVFSQMALPDMVREVEAECRAVEGGERCEGRLTLTF